MNQTNPTPPTPGDLAACPWCKAAWPAVAAQGGSIVGFAVHCQNCGASGPRRTRRADAIAEWQSRPTEPTPDSTLLSAAVSQNDAMRQELAHVGNLVSDLARAMRVDQADADGSWPDLAGRIGKLIEFARNGTETTPDAGLAGEPVGYVCREHLSRRTEYERNGSVMYHAPSGTCTTPVFLTTLSPTVDAVEAAAKAIYEDWQFGTWFGGRKPDWIPGGNSMAQELARGFARAALEASRQRGGEVG